MTNLPKKTKTQQEYSKTNLRLPPELHQEIKTAAEINGRSANAEIIARLQENSSAQILAELSDLKQMVRKILDQM